MHILLGILIRLLIVLGQVAFAIVAQMLMGRLLDGIGTRFRLFRWRRAARRRGEIPVN